MSVRTIAPTRGLKGEVTIPGDKSISHRSIMLGSIALGTTEITHFLEGADCLSTIDCFRRMGISIEEKEGTYDVVCSTASGLEVTRHIFVVNQPFVKNEKANEAVSAFNFFKTVDEIMESVTLDTDLKTWANAQKTKQKSAISCVRRVSPCSNKST